MKNIILLSDGTCSSAGRKNKTIAWRLCAAIELHNDQQIAMYENCAGSKDSTFNSILGDVFGYVLKRMAKLTWAAARKHQQSLPAMS